MVKDTLRPRLEPNASANHRTKETRTEESDGVGVMSDDELRIHLRFSGEKTEQLICNWCGLPHPVEPEYKKEILERGAKQLKELGLTDVTPEETWTCGACYLFVNRVPAELAQKLRTECEHEVPRERQAPQSDCGGN